MTAIAPSESEATGLASYLSERRLEIEAGLERLVPAASRWPATIHRAVRHSLFAGGKRVRPILCLAAAEAVGGESARVLEPACGLEMIHTYSLIHDDLPALDDDELRRGVPTCHVVFGEDMAILAGDALLTLGLETLAHYPEGRAFDETKIRALLVVTEAIGTAGMIGGQVADLEAERERHPTPELLMKIHETKTGCLIRASVAVGGILSLAHSETLAALDRYGLALGLAFQIKDDLLDVEADSVTLGKSSGKDAAQGKATFPAVWGAERSGQILADKIAEAIDIARSLPGGGGHLPELARFVGARKS